MPNDRDPLAPFHPIVRAWFTETLGEPSAPQRAGWPAIASGVDTLILAPTGTGKTLTAFLYELNALIEEGLARPLANAVHLLYVSPLKALSNDIQRNLEAPLTLLKQRFHSAGSSFPEIRVAVRTGDTSPSARARMLRKTPHILITTPESLHLLLTSERGRTIFSSLRAVIVDEIHAVAGTKRGAHLALTLERLVRLAPDAPQRIGLSATQRPLDEIARYLGGTEPRDGDAQPQFRPVQVVDCGLVKAMDVTVRSPVDDLGHVNGTIWTSVVPLVLERIRGARTTLVFVNNRGQAERMAARVNTLAGQELALPYHGSLSRERRLRLEERLKAGDLRALVTTSALELGIDVGSVDLVLQLQSPRRVAAALQRVGRAGHSLAAVSRGVFVPTHRDDALEELAIVSGMQSGDVEPTRVPQNALDVLAQLIVAIVASEMPSWTANQLFDFVRQAYPYHNLTRNAFDETLLMLSGKYPSEVAAELVARIHWDRVSDTLTPARGARMLATVSGGTIPDRGLYAVNLPDRTRLGELDEEFVHESRVGDVFQLGSSTWRIQSVEHDRVIVIPAPGAPARMPFWKGEFMARSRALAPRIGELRRRLAAADSPEARAILQAEFHTDEPTIRSLVEYVQSQRAITGTVPDDRQLVLEYFRDEVGSVRMVLHAPFGARVTAPWGMALGRRLRQRLGVDVQVQTTDDGLLLRLPDLSAPPPTELIRALSADEAQAIVLEDVGGTSLFGARFRMNAGRALLLPRGNARRRMPLWLQRLKAADLLEAVREFPSFPVLVETYRDILQDAFDMEGLRDVLERLASGSLGLRVVPTEHASPFAANIMFGFVQDWMYWDDTPRAESRAALLSLDRSLLNELMGGGADDDTIAVLEELLARRRGTAAGFQARDADELAVLLARAGDLTRPELEARVSGDDDRRGDPIADLLANGRMVAIREVGSGAAVRYILVDDFARYAAALGAQAVGVLLAGRDLAPRSAREVIPEPLRHVSRTAGAARHEILSRYVALAGPTSVDAVVERYGFPADWTELRLLEWERNGVLVRGAFGADRTAARWCSRRLLERARRRELSLARRQVHPVSIERFAWFMQRWQHVTADTRLNGVDAITIAMTQLHGLLKPAVAWERDILPSRVAGDVSAGLSQLSASGQVVWVAEAARQSGDLTQPAIGGLRFFKRGTGHLWLGDPPDATHCSERARAAYDVLAAQGASFTDDLERVIALGTTHLKDALYELVAAGLITNDTIDALRALIRWRPALPPKRPTAPDSTRWLPADFTPSPNRPFMHRRNNPRRLTRWKRPDRPNADQAWNGRWSLVRTPSVMGAPAGDDAPSERAAAIAAQWLARYGVVSRDWWARERPAVTWRAIYWELKRLELRGEVRRGYFVAGLAGAQFAAPEAVELLRASSDAASEDGGLVVLSSSDPANVYALPLAGDKPVERLSRPRGTGALLVTSAGRVLLAAEGRGKRVRFAAAASDAERVAAAGALVRYLQRPSGATRDVVVVSIDGQVAAMSPHRGAFLSAGCRNLGRALVCYARHD